MVNQRFKVFLPVLLLVVVLVGVTFFFSQQTFLTDTFLTFFDLRLDSSGGELVGSTCLIQNAQGINPFNEVVGGEGVCETKHFVYDQKNKLWTTKDNFAGFDTKWDLTFVGKRVLQDRRRVTVSSNVCNAVEGVPTMFPPSQVGTQLFASCETGSGNCFVESTGEDMDVLLEIDSPPSNPLRHTVLWGGKEVCELIGESLQVQFPSTVRLNTVKYRQAFACEIPEGYALVEESFEGERDIDIFSLRFFPNFCVSEPPTLIDVNLGGSEPDPSIIDSLVKGQTVRVPASQILVVRYTAPVLDKLRTKCDFAKEVFDVGSDSCRVKSGFLQVQTDCTQVLADGTACLSEPDAIFETKQLAEQVDCAGVIIEDKGEFKCAIPIPDNVCAEGTLREDGTCPVFSPELTPCPNGYTKREISGKEGIFDCVLNIEGKAVVEGQASRGEPLNPASVLSPEVVEGKSNLPNLLAEALMSIGVFILYVFVALKYSER